MTNPLLGVSRLLCWPLVFGLGLCRAWFIGCSAFARVMSGPSSWPSMLLYGCFILGMCLYVALIWFAPRFSRTMSSSECAQTVIVVGLLGTAALFLGIMGESAVYIGVGTAAIGASAGILETVWTLRLIRRRSAGVSLNVLGVMLVASLFDLGLELLPAPLFLLMGLAMLAMSGICFSRLDGQARLVGRELGTAHKSGGERSREGVRLLARIAIVCLTYCVVHMVSTVVNDDGISGDGALFIRSATNLLVTFALFALFLWHQQVHAVMLFRAVLPVTVLGLIMQNLEVPGFGEASFVVMCAGNKLYDILSLILLAECVRRFVLDAPAIVLFTGLFVASRSAGNLIGIALGQMGMDSRAPFVLSDGLTLVMILVVVACFFWLLPERTLFNRLSGPARPFDSGSGTRPSGSSSDVLDDLALRCGLTVREREVLALLARGKNHPAIMEELSISKGTVHAHVTHVYQKMGVHSQQELIVLVESRMDESDGVPLNKQVDDGLRTSLD